MSLITVQDVKDYCRIQHTAEDTMLASWLAQAIARLEGYVRRPITAEERTFTLEQPSDANTRAIRMLFVPVYPVSDAPALTLTGVDAVELVEGTDYRLDRRTGQITALASVTFAQWPYTIVATVGLSARDDYATRIEPMLNDMILDIVADKYLRRNAAATNETEGGVSVSYDAASGLPKRVCETLKVWRMARAG